MFRFRSLLIFIILAIASPTLAATADCAGLTALQRWAGYLSWLGFFKGLGTVVLAAGFIFMTWGILAQVIFRMKVLLEALAYIVSISLIAAGAWIAPDYQTWAVVTGCIMLAGSVEATLMIHNIKGNDPKGLIALFMAIWAAVAIYYNMSEVGILAMLALVGLLGFTTLVGRMSYAFGFEDERSVLSGTIAALLVLSAFVVIEIFSHTTPDAVSVFKLGAFWIGSFVGFLGLLILSNRYYSDSTGSYGLMQVVTVLFLLGFAAIGMTFNINALAGMAGTFLVFYLAAKPMEVPFHGRIGFGVMLIMTGGIIFGAYWLAMRNLAVTEQYLTVTLR